MTTIKTFLIGALAGTILGATLLGAISHLLIIILALFGAGTIALHSRRRRLTAARSPKNLTPPPEPGT